MRGARALSLPAQMSDAEVDCRRLPPPSPKLLPAASPANAAMGRVMAIVKLNRQKADMSAVSGGSEAG